jgi:hypothetical protein
MISAVLLAFPEQNNICNKGTSKPISYANLKKKTHFKYTHITKWSAVFHDTLSHNAIFSKCTGSLSCDFVCANSCEIRSPYKFLVWGVSLQDGDRKVMLV